MKAIIKNLNEFGGVYSDDYIESYPNLFVDCEFTEVLPSESIVKKIWNGSTWIEGLTTQELQDYNSLIVPNELSRMKFKIQIERSTIYSYDIILEYIKNLAVNDLFTQDKKNELIYRLEDAVSFNRYQQDFINLANMLSVSDAIKDEIFINGKLLN